VLYSTHAITLQCSCLDQPSSILQDDNPNWDKVDNAINEHIETLKETQDNNLKSKDHIEPISPDLFTKTWEEGGLLSNYHIRQLKSNPQVDPNILLGETCMILRTKINGKYTNTSLVDEGATDSVLNIDWYEHRGIDWRKEFGLSPDAIPGVVHMANQSAVPTYGAARAKVALLDAKGKSF
jgi:hypothetical protein